MMNSVRNVLLCDGLCARNVISPANQEDEAVWHDGQDEPSQIPRIVKVPSLPMKWKVPPHEDESLCGLDYVPDETDSLALSVDQEELDDSPTWDDNNDTYNNSTNHGCEEEVDINDHDSTRPQVGLPENHFASAMLDPIRHVVWKPPCEGMTVEGTQFDDGSSYTSFHHGLHGVEDMMTQVDTPCQRTFLGDTQSGFISTSTEATSTTVALTLQESYDD